MDRGLHNVTQALRTAGVWDDTLVIIFSDNGGPYGLEGGPNNFPLRGSKESPWEVCVCVCVCALDAFSLYPL